MGEQRLKVLDLVSYKILPARSGGEKGIALYLKYLGKEADVVCVTTQKNQPEAADGYEVMNILRNSVLRYINIFYFFTLRRIIRQKKITHLEVQHPYYGWLAVLLKWFTPVKLVVHSHNIEGLRWKTLHKWWWKGLWWYEKWVHRQADHNFFKQQEDLDYAIKHFGLLPAQCTVITYGIEWNTPPSAADKQLAAQALREKHGIPAHHTLLLFNGAFNYAPNRKGLEAVLEHINPQLQQIPAFEYTLLICGIHIPAEISSRQHPNTVIAGFVDDVNMYFKGCDVFLNPIITGGGIKTKLVEALGHGMNAVSSQNGAIGVAPGICGGKLTLTNDQLAGFADAIVRAAGYQATIPEAYFDHFYWGDIAKKAVRSIQ